MFNSACLCLFCLFSLPWGLKPSGAGWVFFFFKAAWDGCYWISKGMFGNLIRPSSEHTSYTNVSLGPRSKSLHWSRVNKLQFALWYWEVKTSGNPPLWQHGLRQTMSSVLPHSPSITAPESTCLTVPLSLLLAGWRRPPHLSHFPSKLGSLAAPGTNSASSWNLQNSRTPEGRAGREQTYWLVTVSDVIPAP